MTDPAKLYAELVAAFSAGRWHEAQALTTTLLPLAPRHAGVYGIAGVVSMELQQTSQAEEYLRRATELDPARADFATLHAKALAMLGLWNATLMAADKSLALSSGDPVTLDALGIIYAKAQAHAQAVSAFARAVDLLPENASLRFNLATSLIAIGDVDAAESELQKVVSLDPVYWPAHLALSQIRRQTPDRNHVDLLQSLVTQYPHDIEASIHLNMALAKEYEDLAEYPQAFDHLVRGNAAVNSTRPYSQERDVALFDALMHAFPSSQPITAGYPTDEPIFIVGMPRSGTTLAERIISSHPAVYAAGELQNFAMALQRASGQRAPLMHSPENIAKAVATIDWYQLGSDYLSSARLVSRPEPRFVDKLPHNFLYLGFIAKALPKAKIICLRRDAMDTCLSNFRQLFDRSTSVFDYSSSLLDSGRYYLLFERLMAHWQQVIPGRILDVHYEDLVNQQEPTSRQMLDFCGLPWNDNCLHFESNPAPVATFSALQVRSPMYKSSLMRWMNYEAQMSELKGLLLDGGIDLRG